MSKDLMIPQMGGLPGMPQSLTKIVLPDFKQISPDTGIIGRKIHKSRVKDFVEIAQAENAIITAQADTFNRTMDVMHRWTTESSRIGYELVKIEHDKTMLTLEQEEKKATIYGIHLDNEIKKRTIEQLELKNEGMRGENELNKLDIKYRMKQYEDMFKED